MSSTRSPNGLAGPEPTCMVIRASGPFGGVRTKVTLVTAAPLLVGNPSVIIKSIWPNIL
jgi:hypothetical protein